MIIFLVEYSKSDSKNKNNSCFYEDRKSILEGNLSYCLYDYLENKRNEGSFIEFALKHKKIIKEIIASSRECTTMTEKKETRNLIKKLSREDSTGIMRDIDLWLRQFWEPQ